MSSWSEIFICSFSNKASWFFKLPFPMLTITRVWQEIAMSLSSSKSISWQMFGWRPRSCSSVPPWALISGPEQPFSLYTYFSVCANSTWAVQLCSKGGQVFHKKSPTPGFPHDACSHPVPTSPTARSPWPGLCWGPGWIQSQEIGSVFKAKIIVLNPMEIHVLDVFAPSLLCVSWMPRLGCGS